MSEALQLAANAHVDVYALDDLAASAFELAPVPPHERKGVLRDEAGLLLDRLLVRVARGHGALDVALGEGLAALSIGDRVLRLGFSCLGDYSRERLGLAGSTAEKLARLARNLRERPILREAVWRGEVSARKAETILPVARGEGEAGWVARARVETVRALAAAVKAAGSAAPAGSESDEPWERISLLCRPEQRAKLEEAMALAGKLLGATASKWQRLEAISEEYLGSHPGEEDSGEGEDGGGAAGGAAGGDFIGAMLDRYPSGGALEETKAWLEEETRRWEFLDAIDPVPAPVESAQLACVHLLDLASLDGDLRRLCALRARWDELLGHLAMLLRQLGLWRDMKFANFGHYCTERLGMSERTVSQRVALERRLHELPALRAALRDGRVSYEKARVVASAANESDLDAWIGRAEGLTCIALAREAEDTEEAQMCARGELALRMPARVASLLDSALLAAQSAAGRPLLRDRERCQVPGCSRAAVQVHHVTFRSHGGGDDPSNLVSLCAAHHLHGVHMGWVRVRGEAPRGLRWSFRPPNPEHFPRSSGSRPRHGLCSASP